MQKWALHACMVRLLIVGRLPAPLLPRVCVCVCKHCLVAHKRQVNVAANVVMAVACIHSYSVQLCASHLPWAEHLYAAGLAAAHLPWAAAERRTGGATAASVVAPVLRQAG